MDASANRKILKIGDFTSGGLKLISANSYLATFKDENGKLISIGINNDISSGSSYKKKSEDNNEIIHLNKNNQYIAIISINGKETSSIIDTGANFVTMNSNVAAQLGLDYKNDAAKLNVTTASNKTEGYKVTLNSVMLGKIELNNIEAIVLEGLNPELTLIGMSFLKNLDIQYLGDQLEIKKHINKSSGNSNNTPSNASPNLNPAKKP